tara:strand:+ start:3852 stop:4043 length:192 start_codon:yes stop_codon:yes gene_type:complete
MDNIYMNTIKLTNYNQYGKAETAIITLNIQSEDAKSITLTRINYVSQLDVGDVYYKINGENYA